MVDPKGPLPPSRGSGASIGHSQPPVPAVTASHTCSGEASTPNSRAISNSLDMAGSCLLCVEFRGGLVVDRGMECHDDPVVPAALGVRAVVLADQRAHAGGQFL